MTSENTSTSQSFDAIASDYDAVYGPEGNAVMAWLRGESLTLLQETFPSGSRLLEIGCGTGDEAIHLARSGYTVLATDISPAMATQARAKVDAAGLSNRVSVLTLPAGCIDALRPSQPFDGAFASFGSLNCEPNLERFGDALSCLLRPGAAFVCSVMARWCPFEIVWFLLHARPRTAFRRLRRGWQAVPVTGREGMQVSVSTRYLSTRDVKRAFAPAFTIERALSLPLIMPPPYLDHLFRRYRRLFAGLEALERRLRERSPWRMMGDHLALVLRRTGGDQGEGE